MKKKHHQVVLTVMLVGILVYSVFSITSVRRIWNPLYQTTWQLSLHPTYETLHNEQVRITFGADSIHGQSYVNSFSAHLRYSFDAKLNITNMSSTLMAALDVYVQDAERHFLTFLNQELSYTMQNDQLQLCSLNECLVFVRVVD